VQRIYEAFGFGPGDRPTIAGLIIIIAFIFEPFNTAAKVLQTFISRKYAMSLLAYMSDERQI
jgi:hypothetical protein